MFCGFGLVDLSFCLFSFRLGLLWVFDLLKLLVGLLWVSCCGLIGWFGLLYCLFCYYLCWVERGLCLGLWVFLVCCLWFRFVVFLLWIVGFWIFCLSIDV